MEKSYHFSFDVINVKDNFDDNYEEAKRYILCVLEKTDPNTIKSFNASTYIITYDNKTPKFSDKLTTYLKKELSKYFHYTISKIAKFDNSDLLVLKYNSNQNLEQDFDTLVNTFTCNFTNKKIGKFN